MIWKTLDCIKPSHDAQLRIIERWGGGEWKLFIGCGFLDCYDKALSMPWTLHDDPGDSLILCSICLNPYFSFMVSPLSTLFIEQTRLIELAGVAAEISDIRAQGQTWPSFIFQPAAPLDLSGCVGEGTPAEAIAGEALSLWVGITRGAPEAWASSQGIDEALPQAPAKGKIGRLEGGVASQDALGRYRLGALDKPVLMAIFCASDAIRLRLARSLLDVCEETPGAASVTAAASDSTRSRGSASEKSSGAVVRDEAHVNHQEVLSTEPKVLMEASGAPFAPAMELAPASSSEDDNDIMDDSTAEGEDTATTLPESDDSYKTAQALVTSDSAEPASLPAQTRGEGGGVGKLPELPTVEMLVQDLRIYIVRLLLDSIPRFETLNASGEVSPNTAGDKTPLLGTVSGRQTRRENCTQFFDVLCTLIGKCLQVTCEVISRANHFFRLLSSQLQGSRHGALYSLKMKGSTLTSFDRCEDHTLYEALLLFHSLNLCPLHQYSIHIWTLL